jgi:ferredoxin
VPTPFDVLELDPDAGPAAVEAAYRDRVKEAHPDHGGSVREFLVVRDAYERIAEGYDALDHDADSEPETTAEAADREPPTPDPDQRLVRYVDYELLQERGWELTDPDLFEKAQAADVDGDRCGRCLVEDAQTLLEAAEADEMVWPYACRGGACTNCAVAVLDGEMPTGAGSILPRSMTDRGIRLSCMGAPVSDEATVVFNVKHLPGLDDLRLPISRFEQAELDD